MQTRPYRPDDEAWPRRRDQPTILLERFAYAFLFAMAMALVRLRFDGV